MEECWVWGNLSLRHLRRLRATNMTASYREKTAQELRLLFSKKARGVQYAHWVMHKCIMVKVGGKRNTRKACEMQVNLSKTEGKFVKVGGKE